MLALVKGCLSCYRNDMAIKYDDIIIIDTETTGIFDEDRIIQLAFIVIDANTMSVKNRYSDLCSTSVPIKGEATKVHKKTNDMIKNLPRLKKTETYKMLVKYNKPQNVFVFHNASFDLFMLAKEKFMTKAELIDTLTCAYHIFPKSESFKLQNLTEVQCSVNKRQKHDALSDCVMCQTLLEKMTVMILSF